MSSFANLKAQLIKKKELLVSQQSTNVSQHAPTTSTKTNSIFHSNKKKKKDKKKSHKSSSHSKERNERILDNEEQSQLNQDLINSRLILKKKTEIYNKMEDDEDGHQSSKKMKIGQQDSQSDDSDDQAGKLLFTEERSTAKPAKDRELDPDILAFRQKNYTLPQPDEEDTYNVDKESDNVTELDKIPDSIHYSHVSHNEVRIHGVGYYMFSDDPATRRKELEYIKHIHAETVVSIEEKAEKEYQEKLKLNAAIKNTYMYLLNHLTEEQWEELLPTPVKEVAKVVEPIEREEQTSDVVREWDKNKMFFEAAKKKTYEQKRREERDEEFAPPSVQVLRRYARDLDEATSGPATEEQRGGDGADVGGGGQEEEVTYDSAGRRKQTQPPANPPTTATTTTTPGADPAPAPPRVVTRGGRPELPYNSDYYDTHGDGSLDNLRPFFGVQEKPADEEVMRRVGQRVLRQMGVVEQVLEQEEEHRLGEQYHGVHHGYASSIDEGRSEQAYGGQVANDSYYYHYKSWLPYSGGGVGGYDPGTRLSADAVLGSAPNINAGDKSWANYAPNAPHVPGFSANLPVPGFNPNLPVPGFDPNLPPPGFNPNLPVPGFNPNLPPPGFNPNAPHLPIPGFNPNAPKLPKTEMNSNSTNSQGYTYHPPQQPAPPTSSYSDQYNQTVAETPFDSSPLPTWWQELKTSLQSDSTISDAAPAP